MSERGLSKGDSLALKGIAIMMMFFHHLYKAPEEADLSQISFEPFSDSKVSAFALSCKICVSIFAFISGYGLLKSFQKNINNNKTVIGWDLRRVLKTISGFWFIYWVVFIITMLIDRLPVKKYFQGSTTAGLLYLLNDFLGLADYFETPTLTATWWYMGAAVIYIFIVPIFYYMSRKIGFISILVLISALPRLLQVDYPGGTNAYTFLFPLVFGMLFADQNLFERISFHLSCNMKLVTIFSFVLLFVSLIACVYIYESSYDAPFAWELVFGILPSCFILLCRFSILRLKCISLCLRFIGKHSMTIFLTHTFVILRYPIFNRLFSLLTDNFIVMYVCLFAVCLYGAVILDFIKKQIGYDSLVQYCIEKIEL